jgi:hypothetical protein
MRKIVNKVPTTEKLWGKHQGQTCAYEGSERFQQKEKKCGTNLRAA